MKKNFEFSNSKMFESCDYAGFIGIQKRFLNDPDNEKFLSEKQIETLYEKGFCSHNMSESSTAAEFFIHFKNEELDEFLNIIR